MAHVVTVLPESFLACEGTLRVHCVPALEDNLVWVAECVETGEAILVDGPPDEGMLAAIDALDVNITAVWNTHTHPDHIGINVLLAQKGRLDALAVVASRDANLDVPGLTRAVDDGDTVQVGNVTAKVWRTDGHQTGHITFVFDDVIFCGDTLFAGGCGFLFDGPPEEMHTSLMRLASLPPETRVCCAHEYTTDNLAYAAHVEPGNATLMARVADVTERRALGECVVPSTIAVERATNPFLRPGSPEIMASVRTAGLLNDSNLPSD
ncbi:MAG: hydroxyacylglutathione hydrolase, partial [Myxococcota bacterium]